MSLQSMTGFARVDGADERAAWFFEARSVNGKGLDVRLRFPPGFDALEAPIRALAAERFRRGNINIALTVQRAGAPLEIRVNEAALEQVMSAASRVGARVGAGQVSPDAIFATKGVLEVVELAEDEAQRQARLDALVAGCADCLDALAASRHAEGTKLKQALSGQIDDIENLTRRIAGSKARQPDQIASRLAQQVARLLDTSSSLDADRLHQEAVVLATRADVAEELTRLQAHIASARDLLAENAAVGRRLDFLAQEFNREANTICAKSNDTEVTQAGMALKVVIDQVREQVQNVE